MHGKLNITLVSLLILVLAYSCNKPAQPDPYYGYDYYPLEKGHWVVYDVDSIDFNAFTGKVDTFRYQVKEIISDLMDFDGNEGVKYSSHEFKRFSRTNDSLPWVLNWAGYLNLHRERLEKVENNEKIVNLIFPVRKDKSWKGNAFNNLEDWDFKYIEVIEPMHFAGQRFDSTLTVLQAEVINLIEERKYQEIYGRGIGLVKKEIVDVKTDIDGKVKSGLKYFQTVNSFGK